MKLLPRQIECIHSCSELCKDSYDDFKEKTSIVRIEDKDTDTQSYVLTKNNDIIVCGQGTTTFKDWTIDFQIQRTKLDFLPSGMVHSGFAKAYTSVREKIKSEIDILLTKNSNYNRIICTGHSLFGAIATIAATDLALVYEDIPVHCITFGSPRVGCARFVKLFDKVVEKSFRCVYKNDPISRVPLCIRFEHVPGKVKYGGKTSLNDVISCCGVENHSIDTYVNATKPLRMRFYEFAKSKGLPIKSMSSDEMNQVILDNI